MDEIYRTKRILSSLGYLAPAYFEAQGQQPQLAQQPFLIPHLKCVQVCGSMTALARSTPILISPRDDMRPKAGGIFQFRGGKDKSGYGVRLRPAL